MNCLFILLLLFSCGNNNSCGCNNCNDCDNTCGASCNRNSCDNNNSCGCNNNNNCDNNDSCDCDNISERFFDRNERNDCPCEEKMERRQTRSNFPNFNNRSETCGCEE